MIVFLFFFLSEFQVFSYAYGGLHRWSPHGEKAAKVRFGSQRKQKKKVTGKKVKHNLINYSKRNFK